MTIQWCWTLKLAIRLGISGVLTFSSQEAIAQNQIVPDNTLGNERSIVTPDTIEGRESDRLEGGARRSANVFHSFSEFNVGEGRGAYFASPEGIENILSRVTGGSRSEILGTLGVLGNANLFLINPNGILFGPNASLDITGSFVGTTASGIEFGDRGLFSATNPNAPSQLLTVNPAALLFNQIAAQPIINRSVSPNSQNPEIPDGLRVPTQESLLLVGGEVRLEGGSLRAPGGRIELGGLAAPGIVGLTVNGSDLSLSFPDGVARADVSLLGVSTIPEIDVTAGDGGDIAIFARNIHVLDGSDICAGIGADGACGGLAPGSGYVGAQAGDITLDAQGTIAIAALFSEVNNNVNSDAVGNGGHVNIKARSIRIADGARISASTSGQGDAGRINISARDTVFLRDGNSRDTFIFNNVESGATGNSGGINITTGSLSVNDGAQIQSEVEGAGNSGPIIIHASDTVSFDGRDASDFPSAATSGVEEGAIGNSGGIVIITDSFSMTNRAQLLSNTAGQGNAGSISIEAQDRVFLLNSDISSEVSEEGGLGRGGDINIKTGNLLVQRGSSLRADTENFGDAGNITIEARDRVVVEGEGLGAGRNSTDIFPSQITATVDSNTFAATGEGGDITISTGALLIADEAFINTSTEGLGNAGDINLTATDFISVRAGGLVLADTEGIGDAGSLFIDTDKININGGENAFITGLFAEVEENATGIGGNINIRAASLSISNGAQISAESLGQGNAGNITIAAEGALSATDGNIVTAAERASGGAIAITAEAIRLQGDSNIRTEVASGTGGGGNITLTADSILAFDDSDIFAFARDGQGGNISLETSAFFGESFRREPSNINPDDLDGNARVDINASGAVSGAITLPDVSFIQNSLTELPQTPIDPATLLATSCIVRGDRARNSFTVTGSGGLPSRPNDAFVTSFPIGEIQTIPPAEESELAQSSRRNSESAPASNFSRGGWQEGDPVVEPTGVYRLPSGQLIISRECS
ncbi:MAG: filamentous hemagglutinin N-terminal domain-containing protein [Cyanophyceae cyanobacterium]